MKEISRTPFNSIFFVCVIMTVLFTFVFFMREIENPLLFIVAYLLIIILYILSRISRVNDIKYDNSKVIITQSITGNKNEFSYENLKIVQREPVTAAGILLVFYSKDGTKKHFGNTGCDIDEIVEMVEFINRRIEEKKKSKE